MVLCKLNAFCQKIGTGINKKYSQIEGDDNPMANSDAHIVLHCLVFPPMEVVGDQTGGQDGEDGDEEVEPRVL